MKTAKEKALEVATAYARDTGVLPMSGEHFDCLVANIELALKVQDRDTRHACAEAVIHATDPHAACMNVRAV